MSAVVIQLASRRRKAAPSTIPCPPPEVERLPLAIQAHPGAVALHLPDTEFWLTAEQAWEIAYDLLLSADLADVEAGR